MLSISPHIGCPKRMYVRGFFFFFAKMRFVDSLRDYFLSLNPSDVTHVTLVFIFHSKCLFSTGEGNLNSLGRKEGKKEGSKEGSKEGASSKWKPFIFCTCKISASVTKYHHRYMKARVQDKKKKKKNSNFDKSLCGRHLKLHQAKDRRMWVMLGLGAVGTDLSLIQ